jgi:nitrogen-specific signal transduction histidine kinase
MKADRSESLGPIAAGLAEEMNELLTRILGAVSAAPHRTEGDTLSEIEAACLAGREVTRRLQVMARGGDGARTLASPRALLEEAAKTAGAATSAEILVDVAEGTDAVWVDAAQIGQAFRNLIRNSLEALSPAPHKPRVLLRAANTALEPGKVFGLPAGDYVEFEVRDNGCGIPPESLEKIWEPFFTTRKHGAGLGLPAALSAVRRHGGQIGVDSEIGVGTVFTVFLPRANPPGAVSAQAAPSARFRTGRILVVEDNPKIRSATGGMLERLNYKVDLAPNGAEAVAHYRRYFDVGRPYDLVLLDLNLPGEPGEGIFKELRGVDSDARILATSGAMAEEVGPRCLALGFCGVVAKPYRLSELGQAIQTVLG